MATTIHYRVSGHGGVVSRLIMRIVMVTIWVIGVISQLTEFP